MLFGSKYFAIGNKFAEAHYVTNREGKIQKREMEERYK